MNKVFYPYLLFLTLLFLTGIGESKAYNTTDVGTFTHIESLVNFESVRADDGAIHKFHSGIPGAEKDVKLEAVEIEEEENVSTKKRLAKAKQFFSFLHEDYSLSRIQDNYLHSTSFKDFTPFASSKSLCLKLGVLRI